MERKAPGPLEFIALTAMSISLVAMSIDSMLPALGAIATDLGAAGPNDRQLVLTTFFGGLTFGQVLYGPLSDALGRKRAMFLGVGILVTGTLMCMFAQSFALMLAGRFVAGLGASGPRIVSVAIVRDLYEGRAMARVMSFVMMVFILVPVLAPWLGQLLLSLGTWRTIFAALAALTALVTAWFAARQPETLAPERRRPLSIGPIARAIAEAAGNRYTLGYTLAAGLVFGAMVAFLATVQQIFGEQYGLGDKFPLYFAILASALGVSSFANARLVTRFGMRAISSVALRISFGASLVALVACFGSAGHPPLAMFMAYMLIVFFCNGLMFSNFNALAMEPMGHIAGSAAAVIGSLTSLVSVLIGTPIGRAYDGTVTPVIGGLTVLTFLSLATMTWIERGRSVPTVASGESPAG